MKLHYLLIAGFLLFFESNGLAATQQLTFNFQAEEINAARWKNLQVKEGLKLLEERFGISFMFMDEIGDHNLLFPESLDASQRVGSVLRELTELNDGLKITRISDGFYTVSFENEAYANHLDEQTTGNANENRLQQQVTERLISGRITTPDGETVPGVNIIVKDTSKGTVTDVNGNFELMVSEGPVDLVVSFIGYKKKEVHFDADQRYVQIVLEEDIQSLEEVIVVAYNEQTKASYTGSAVEVKMQKIQGAPRASFQESLQGNVAGVHSLSSSGQPGYSPNIRIRGIGSINASSDPLYVIDGIPVIAGNITQIATSANTIAGLNPNDIESITVLKDASATSIYGSRGANGVILITTKQGRTGKTNFEVTVQNGVSSILMEDRNKPLTTPELAELLVESRINDGDTPAEAEEYIYSRIDESINTDWFDVISRQGQYQQYFISASGGNEKTNFYTSVGVYDQDATIIGIDYRKLNAKVNVRHTATDRLILDLGFSANNQLLHTNSEAGSANNPVRSMARVVPWEPVYNADGSYNTDILLTYNPVGIVEKNIRETNLYSALGNLGLKYFFTDNFSFESMGNLDFHLADEFQYDNPFFGEGRNDGGRGRAFNRLMINWNITNLVRYKFELNDKHAFNITGGQEAQRIDSKSVYAYASNYGAPTLTTLENASVYMNATSSATASTLTSFFATANYLFNDIYVINISARRDGSSRFGSSVRFANFGSIGFGWNIHNEGFFNQEGFVNELKIRASYGVNGNQGIGDFESRGLYNTGQDYNGQPGYAYNQQSNPYLTWEKNKPFNVGVDFRMFERIGGTVEYYNRITSDLLLNVPLSAVNGLTSYLANIGEMKNEGLEISLSTINLSQKSKLSWNTDFTFTTNRNEVLKLKDDEPIISGQFIRREGADFYTFYMPGYAGVDPENGDALWYVDETETEVTNNYGEAKPYEQGNASPKFFAGLTNSFQYGNFGFSFLVYANYGNKVYDYWGRYVHSDGSAQLNDRGNMSRKIYDRRWQQPGDVTDVPKVVWGNSQSGRSTQHSTRFLYDGTYVRLRDVTFSYRLPEKVTSKVKLSNARLYVRGNNLFTWVKDKNNETDPEVGITGMTDLRIPISRQILFGIDISF